MGKFEINSCNPFLTFAAKDCQPNVANDKATFTLNLQNIYQCMVTKVVNKETVSLKWVDNVRNFMNLLHETF